MTGRRVLGGAGLLMIAVGAWSLLAHLAGRLPALVLWLGLPLVAHDFVLVPVTLALAWLVRRLLPRGWWGPMAVGAAVSAALVLIAAADAWGPARGTVPGLLDRDYGWGLLVALTVTWLTVAAAGVVIGRDERGAG